MEEAAPLCRPEMEGQIGLRQMCGVEETGVDFSQSPE